MGRRGGLHCCSAAEPKTILSIQSDVMLLVKSLHFAAMEMGALEEIIHIKVGTAAAFNTLYTHLGNLRLMVPLLNFTKVVYH